jgi:hypothetical protein
MSQAREGAPEGGLVSITGGGSKSLVSESDGGSEAGSQARDTAACVGPPRQLLTRCAASGGYCLTRRKSYTPTRESVPAACRPLSLTM